MDYSAEAWAARAGVLGAMKVTYWGAFPTREAAEAAIDGWLAPYLVGKTVKIARYGNERSFHVYAR